MQGLWIVDRRDPRAAVVRDRDQALLRGGRLMRALRLFWTLRPRRRPQRAPVPREPRDPGRRVADHARAPGSSCSALVFDQVDDLNGWTHAELLAVMGVHIAGRRDHRHVHPAEHGAADRRRPAGHARLRPDEARGRARSSSASARSGSGSLVDVVARDASCSRSPPARSRDRSAVRAWLAFLAALAARRRDDLLLLADPHDRARSGSCAWTRSSSCSRASTRPGRWPVDDLPGLAADRPHVPRPDRVRGDGAGPGVHRPTDPRDPRTGRGCSRSGCSSSRACSGGSACAATPARRRDVVRGMRRDATVYVVVMR